MKKKRRTWRSVIRACRLGKWRSLASGKYNARKGEPGCALCMAVPSKVEDDESPNCNFCPVTACGGGDLQCGGTPYRLWQVLKGRYGFNDPRTVAMAKAEIAYLRAVEVATPANALVRG